MLWPTLWQIARTVRNGMIKEIYFVFKNEEIRNQFDFSGK
jgi:hypothetical protein